MGSGATTEWSLPYPLSTDPNNVPSDMQALATALDGLIFGGASGTLANRPAAGKARRVYYATDTGLLYYDTGSAWVYFSPGSGLAQARGDMVIASAANTLARLPVGGDGSVLRARSTAGNGLGVDWETVSLPADREWAITGAPQVTAADEDPYPGVAVRVPANVTVKLHGVLAVAPGASSAPTFKLRRYTAGAWADVAGFGTTVAPLTASTVTAPGYTTPGDVTLADGDVLGLWVVAAGTGATGLRVTALIDTYQS